MHSNTAAVKSVSVSMLISVPVKLSLTITTRGGDAEKKTEASFVRLDYATEDKEAHKSKQTTSFRLLKSFKHPQLHYHHVPPANLPLCLLKMQLC